MARTGVLARIAAATRAPRPPCVVCGRPSRAGPISLPNAPKGMGPACSSSCIETIRHRKPR
jgi:hypothetical protein